MRELVLLHDLRGEEVLVNATHVRMAVPEFGKTVLMLDDGDRLDVTESVLEVAAELQRGATASFLATARCLECGEWTEQGYYHLPVNCTTHWDILCDSCDVKRDEISKAEAQPVG